MGWGPQRSHIFLLRADLRFGQAPKLLVLDKHILRVAGGGSPTLIKQPGLFQSFFLLLKKYKIFRATSFCTAGDGQRTVRRAWTSGVHCLPEKQAQDPASSPTSAVTVQNSNRAPEAFEDLFTRH